MESEGAAGAQFEKSLEGIEAKTQQLQTSLQNLYTSAGLEEFYSFVLTIGSNILDFYNDIASAFGGSFKGLLAAVATFGAQFYNLARIVMSVIRLAKEHFINAQKEATTQANTEVKKRANTELYTAEELRAKMAQIHKELEKEKTEISRKELRKRAQEQLAAEKQAQQQKVGWFKKNGSMLGSAITAGTSIIGGMLTNSTASAAVSGIGGALGGIAQFYAGDWVGGVMSVISSLGPLVTLFTQLTTITDELAEAQEKYNKALEESSKKRSEATKLSNEADALESLKKKLEETAKKRYDSAEAYEEWLSVMKEIAGQYPSMIDYYDQEHNAIIDTTTALEEQIKKRKEAAALAEKEAIIAEAGADSRYGISITGAKPFNEKSSSKNTTAKIHNIENSIIQGEYSTASEAMMALFEPGYLFDVSNPSNDRANRNEVYNLFGGKMSDAQLYWYTSNYKSAQGPAKELVEKLQQAEADGTSIKDAFKEWEATLANNLTEYSQEASQVHEVFQYILQYIINPEEVTAARTELLHRAALTFVNSLDLENYSSLQIQALVKLFEDNFKAGNGGATLAPSATQEDFQQELKTFWNVQNADEYTINKTDYYGTVEKTAIEQIDNAFAHLEDYTQKRLEGLVASLDGVSTSKAGADIQKQWEKQYKEAYENAEKALASILNVDELSDYEKSRVNALAPKFLSAYIQTLRDTADKSKEDAIGLVQEIWSAMAADTDDAQKEVAKIIQENDLTTLSGINNAIDAIKNLKIIDPGLKGDIEQDLQELQKYININVNTELQTYFSSLQSDLSDLEGALKEASSGMDFPAMIAAIEKYNISIEQFQFKDGKYYLNNIDTILNKYITDRTEYLDTLQAEFNNMDTSAENYNEIKQEIETLFDQIYELQNYANVYLKNTFLLQTGQISKFLESIPTADVNTLWQEILNGDYTNIPREYVSAVIAAVEKANTDLYDILIGQIAGSGGASTIEATEVNKGLLNKLGLASEDLEIGDKVLIDWTKATAEQISALQQQFLDDAGLSLDEKNEYLRKIYDSQIKRDRTEALVKIVESYANFDRETAEAYALSVGKTVEQLQNEGIFVLNEVTGVYSMAYATLQAQIAKAHNEIQSDEELAKLQDAISTLYTGIANNIVKALEGTLNSTEALDLQKSVYDIFGIELDFSSTVKGLGLSNEAAATLYRALMAIDAVAANIVFDSLYQSLTKSEAVCENISVTMRRLTEMQKEINALTAKGTDTDKKRLQILKDQAAVYTRIAYKQSMDANSFKFMDRSLPTGYESPINYWQSAINSFDVIKNAGENGYIALTDFYNIVTEMSNIAAITEQTITVFGQEISGNLLETSALIQKGFESWTDIDGVASISAEAAQAMGLNFEAGVEDSQEGVQNGIKAFAKQQIQMLDAMIHALEGVEALEQLSGDNSLGNVLANFYTTDEATGKQIANENVLNEWVDWLQQQIADNTAIGNLVNKIQVGNQNLIAYLQNNNVVEEEKYNLLSHLNELITNGDWGADLSEVADKWASQGFTFDTKSGFLNFETPVEADVPLTLKVVLEGIDAEGLKGFSDLLEKLLQVNPEGDIDLTGTMGKDFAYTLKLARTENGDQVTLTVGGQTYNSAPFDATNSDLLHAQVEAIIDQAAKDLKIFKITDTDFTVTGVNTNNSTYIATEEGDTIVFHKKIDSNGKPMVIITGVNEKGIAYPPQKALEMYFKQKQKEAEISNEQLQITSGSKYIAYDTGSGLTYEVKIGDNGANAAINIGGVRLGQWTSTSGETLEAAVNKAAETYQKAYGSNSFSTIAIPKSANSLKGIDAGSSLSYEVVIADDGTGADIYIGGKFISFWNGVGTLEAALNGACLTYQTQFGSGTLKGFSPNLTRSNETIEGVDEGTSLGYTVKLADNGASADIWIGGHYIKWWQSGSGQTLSNAIQDACLYYQDTYTKVATPTLPTNTQEVFVKDEGITIEYTISPNEADGKFYLPDGTGPVSKEAFIGGIQDWLTTNRDAITEILTNTGLHKIELASSPDGLKVNLIGDYWAADGTGIGYYLKLNTSEDGNVNGYQTSTIKTAIDSATNWLKSLEEKYGSGEAIADALGAGKLVINPETNGITMEDIPIGNGYIIDYNLQITTTGSAEATSQKLAAMKTTIESLQKQYDELVALSASEQTEETEQSTDTPITPFEKLLFDLGLTIEVTDSGVTVNGSNLNGLKPSYDSIDAFMEALEELYKQKFDKTIDVNANTQVEATEEVTTASQTDKARAIAARAALEGEDSHFASSLRFFTGTSGNNMPWEQFLVDIVEGTIPFKSGADLDTAYAGLAGYESITQETEEQILDEVTQIAEEKTNPTTEGTKTPDTKNVLTDEEIVADLKETINDATILAKDKIRDMAWATQNKSDNAEQLRNEAVAINKWIPVLQESLNVLNTKEEQGPRQTQDLSQDQIKYLYDNQVSNDSIDTIIGQLEDSKSDDETTNAQIQQTIDWLSALKEGSSNQLEKMNQIAAKTRLPYTPLQFRTALDGISIHGDFNGSQLVVPDGNGGWYHFGLQGSTGAKGNAKAKGTLMGELGPELYVTGGHYYVAGQNGAEFVDLPDDAIVFNHLQTQRLMKTGAAGRGSAVTNEKKATSYSKGNVAMASASDTLAKLRELRALWDSILNQDFRTLTNAAGGGGGGGSEESKKFLYDLDRWYNLLRQIEKVEEQINYQQALRQNMQSGYKYVRSLEYELSLLEKEESNYRMLANLQESYYQARKADQEASIYSYFFNYDDEGLMQYRDEGFHLIADLNRTDTTGQAIYTSEQQIAAITNALKAAGYDAGLITDTLYYDETGEKLTDAADIIENFYDKFDGWIEEMDSEFDSFNEYRTKTQEALKKQNEILEEYRELQLTLEKQLLEAIENREQKIIDALQDEKDALQDASDKYLTGLSDALNKERQLYQDNQKDTELLKLQRQLAILQRSGGSASDIRSLQDQINSKLQDRYFDAQQTEIDAIKEASDKQLEMMQNQIDLMTETLEYQKENGLLWAEVSEKMNTWKPEELANFVQENSPEFAAASLEEQTKTMQESIKEFEKWYEYIHNYRAFNQFYDQIDTDTLKNEYGINVDDPTMLQRARATAKVAYQKEYQRQIDEEGADSDTAHRLAEEAALRALKEDYSLHPAMGPGHSGIDTTGAISSGSGTGSNAGGKGYKWYWNEAANSERYALEEWAKDNKLDGTYLFDTPQGSLENYKKAPSSSLAGHTDMVAEHYWATPVLNKDGHEGAFVSLEKAGDDAAADIINQMKAAGFTEQEIKDAMWNLQPYSEGGLNDYTGLAMLHGTKRKPEAVLTPEQTKVLREEILSNRPNSLLSLLSDFRATLNNMATGSTIEQSGSLIIENATVNMNVQSIANDYDARRAGEQALEEMMRIARKTGAQSLRR